MIETVGGGAGVLVWSLREAPALIAFGVCADNVERQEGLQLFHLAREQDPVSKGAEPRGVQVVAVFFEGKLTGAEFAGPLAFVGIEFAWVRHRRCFPESLEG